MIISSWNLIETVGTAATARFFFIFCDKKKKKKKGLDGFNEPMHVVHTNLDYSTENWEESSIKYMFIKVLS